jgi:hypothetical protein
MLLLITIADSVITCNTVTSTSGHADKMLTTASCAFLELADPSEANNTFFTSIHSFI